MLGKLRVEACKRAVMMSHHHAAVIFCFHFRCENCGFISVSEIFLCLPIFFFLPTNVSNFEVQTKTMRGDNSGIFIL